MWDDIKIETEGDLHHYFNNALSVLATDASNIKHRADGDFGGLAKIADRIEKTVDNLTLLRDALILKLKEEKK